MSSVTDLTRRSFLYSSGVGVLGASLAEAAHVRQKRKKPGANDQVRFGVIGCRGMGSSDMASALKIPEVECVALCDVDETILGERVERFFEATGKKPATYADHRALLDRDDIDAVIIGTPDHWHAIQMIEACQAGKDVYVEKPMAHSIEEADLMVQAAKRYERVVQVGQWQRSGSHWAEAIAYLHSGKLGKVRTVKTWAFMDWDPIEPKKDSPVPEGVDYDRWLGPRPVRPFNENRFHFEFRWFWDYAGGLMTDWGVHLIDIVLWAMDRDSPDSVMSMGGQYGGYENGMETPDTQQAMYDFGDFSMIWEHAAGTRLGPFEKGHGVAFICNNGTLVIDRGGYKMIPGLKKDDGKVVGYRTEAIPPRGRGSGGGGLDQHTENFVECMKTRAQPVCNAEIGRGAAINAQLGNVAFRTGRRVYWDHEKRTFTGDDEANQFLKLRYRDKYPLPKVG